MEAKRSLSGREKFAYGIGAVGKDMVYMLSASYISIYFLDVMGISAAAIAVLLMAARVFYAFNDPIMGVLVAKTKTDRKSTRLNSSHANESRMPSSA